jgi:hypothetical protein
MKKKKHKEGKGRKRKRKRGLQLDVKWGVLGGDQNGSY